MSKLFDAYLRRALETTSRLPAGFNLATARTHVDEGCLRRMQLDCIEFMNDVGHIIEEIGTEEEAGRCFWDARSGDGRGFLDNNWPRKHGLTLQARAHQYGTFHIIAR